MSKDSPWWLSAASLDPRASSERSQAWCPAADIYRTSRGWLVKFDLAGIRPTDDVRIERCGDLLRLVGSRRDSTVRQGLASYSLEISYNRFERSVQLPENVEGARLRTEYDNGMLLVWIDNETR